MSGIDYQAILAAVGKPRHTFWRDHNGIIHEQTPQVAKAIRDEKIKQAKKPKRQNPENGANKMHLMTECDGPQTVKAIQQCRFKTPQIHALALAVLEKIEKERALDRLGIEEIPAIPETSQKAPVQETPKDGELPAGFFSQESQAPEAPKTVIEGPGEIPTSAAIQRMNKKQLMDLANEKGIDMSNARNKAEMVETILNNLQ